MALSKRLCKSWAMVALLSVSSLFAAPGCSAPGANPDEGIDSEVPSCANGVVAVKTKPGSPPECPDSSAIDAGRDVIIPDVVVAEVSQPDAEAGPETKPDAGHDADADADADADVVDPIDASDTADAADTQDAPDVALDAPDASVDADAASDAAETPDTATEVADTADATSDVDATITDTSETSVPDADAPLPETGTDVADVSDVGDDAVVTAARPLNCHDYKRDPAFDAIKIDAGPDAAPYDLESTSTGVTMLNPATGAYDDFVAVNISLQGFVYRRDGLTGAWSQDFAFPSVCQSNVASLSVRASAGTIYASWNDCDHPHLSIRASGSGWTELTGVPSADFYGKVYVAENGALYLHTILSGSFDVWRKPAGAAAWSVIPQTALTPPAGALYTESNMLFGLDANTAYLSGYFTDDPGNRLGCFLLKCESTCTSMSVPDDCGVLIGVSATSQSDVFTTGITKDGTGVVYHITASRPSWTESVNTKLTSYSSVTSPWPGAVIAAGNGLATTGAGSLVLTTMDQINPTVTASVDSKAWNASSFWFSPDGHTVHFLTMAVGTIPDGFYTADCPNSP